MTTYLRNIVTFISNEEGGTSIEYGLLATLIALVIIAGASALGISLSGLFTSNADKVADALPK